MPRTGHRIVNTLLRFYVTLSTRNRDGGYKDVFISCVNFIYAILLYSCMTTLYLLNVHNVFLYTLLHVLYSMPLELFLVINVTRY